MAAWVVRLIVAVLLGVAEAVALAAASGLLGVAALITSGSAAIGLPVPLQGVSRAFTEAVPRSPATRERPATDELAALAAEEAAPAEDAVAEAMAGAAEPDGIGPSGGTRQESADPDGRPGAAPGRTDQSAT